MKIKKCPFCGSKDTFCASIGHQAWVKCNTCYADGPTKKNEQNAIKAWNAAPRKKEAYHSFCALHGIALQHVRPGKWQCAECEKGIS